MTAYVLAQISIHDRATYDRYAAGFMPTLRPYDGHLLSADEHPMVLEGTWPHQKAILIGFPDQESALRWMASPAYRAISEDRLAATTGTAILLRGVG